MASGPSAAVANQLLTLFRDGTAGGLTDGQLLDRFVHRRDEAAFAALVERHGPMVLRVCRNRLGDRHDAEDAFQATFLVLARKAGSIRQSEAVAGWLFGVAGRVSAKALAAGRRRIRAERQAGVSSDGATSEKPPETWTELYEEVDRLPEKYRLPLILCHLEGLTYEQAAARLHCPVRTIQTRLARGRQRLRGRLERRGLAPLAAIGGLGFTSELGKAIVPVSLRDAVATAALRFMSGEGIAAGGASAATLAGEVLRAMLINQIGAVTKLAILLGFIGFGGWMAGMGVATPLAPPPPPQAAGPQALGVPPQAPAVPATEQSPFRMTGTVRVEGTGEPVAGAKVQVDLGSKDLSGDFREAVTDANGRYTIPLPEGNARPLFFTPPPGYWLPDAAKNWTFFAVTPREPVYRKDYQVRGGTTWTFRLTRSPKHEPVVPGFVASYHLPGEFPIFIREKTDARGYATVTLPDEAAKVTISLMDQEESRILVKLEWSHGFRPGAVKGDKRIDGPGEPRFQIVDEVGGTATASGPVEVVVERGRLILSASLPAIGSRALGSINGTVIDRDGHAVGGVNIALFYTYRQWGTMSGSREHRVRTDAQGRFVLRRVPKRSYEGDPTKLSIIAYKDGFAGRDTPTSEFQPDDDGSQTLDPIRLDPGLALTGRVVDPEGRPVAGAEVRPAGSWAESVDTYRSGPDGRFTIPNLGRGVVRVGFTFGPLIASGSYVVDGQAEPVTVRLRPAPRQPAAAVPRPAPPQRLKVGANAPNWVVRGWTDGKTRSLGELRGRVVCLDFWNIRSGGKLLPALNRLRERFESRGVVFLSVHTPDGSLDQIRKLYGLENVSLVSAIDEGPEDQIGQGVTASLYGVRGFPWSFVIDRSGKVAFNSHDPANQGAMAAIVRKLRIDPTKAPTEEQINQLLETLLGEVIEKVLAQP